MASIGTAETENLRDTKLNYFSLSIVISTAHTAARKQPTRKMATELEAPVAPVQVGVGSVNSLERLSKASMLLVLRPLVKEAAFEFGGRKRAAEELRFKGKPYSKRMRRIKKEREALIDIAPDLATLRKDTATVKASYDAEKAAKETATEGERAALSEMTATVKYYKALRVDAMKETGIYAEEYVIPDDVKLELNGEQESVVHVDIETSAVEGGA